jgi:hypothetical protein
MVSLVVAQSITLIYVTPIFPNAEDHARTSVQRQRYPIVAAGRRRQRRLFVSSGTKCRGTSYPLRWSKEPAVEVVGVVGATPKQQYPQGGGPLDALPGASCRRRSSAMRCAAQFQPVGSCGQADRFLSSLQAATRHRSATHLNKFNRRCSSGPWQPRVGMVSSARRRHRGHPVRRRGTGSSPTGRRRRRELGVIALGNAA